MVRPEDRKALYAKIRAERLAPHAAAINAYLAAQPYVGK